MIEEEVLHKIWLPLVRETTQTKEYPGYRYDFFRTFAELDIYFTAVCGEDWLTQEWAKYWFGQHRMSCKAFKKELAIRAGTRQARPYVDRSPMHELYERAKSEGVRLSVRSLMRYFRTHGQVISKNTVHRFLQKIQQLERDNQNAESEL